MNHAHFQIIGKRWRQEDAYFISDDFKLFAIFDGVGGSHDGLLASTLLVKAIKQQYAASNISTISDFKNFTSELVNTLGNKTTLHVAATMALVYVGDQSIYIANIGDTRVYSLDQKTKEWEVTRDHSVVQELFEAGIIKSEAEMRRHPLKNQITKAISSTEQIAEEEIEFKKIERPDHGSYILLASDGVFEAFDHEGLMQVLLNKDWARVEDKIQEIEARCQVVSKDNSTCIIVEV